MQPWAPCRIALRLLILSWYRAVSADKEQQTSQEPSSATCGVLPSPHSALPEPESLHHCPDGKPDSDHGE